MRRFLLPSALLAAAVVTLGTAVTEEQTPAGAVPAPPAVEVPAVSDGGGESSGTVARVVTGEVPAEQGTPAPEQDPGSTDAPAPSPAPAEQNHGSTDAPAEQDTSADPDALTDDHAYVCHALDMGAAACESFVNPDPGTVSVAVLYSDDDEHAIVEIIAYQDGERVEVTDFWEGDVPVQ